MNATVGLGHSNLVDSSTLSGGNWKTARPLTEIQTRELVRYAESETSSPTDTEIIVDHGSAKTARLVGLFATAQIASAATVQVVRGTTAGANNVIEGDVLSCWPFSPLDGVLDGGYFGIFVVLPADTSARYTTIRLINSAAVRIGRLVVAPLFVPGTNPVVLSSDWQPDYSSVDRTENGADQVAQRSRLRHVPLEFQGLTRAEGSLLHEIQRTHGTTGELVYVPDIRPHAAARARTQQLGCLVIARQLSKLEHPYAQLDALALGLDERGGAP